MASPILDKRQRLLVAQVLEQGAKTASGRAGYCKSRARNCRSPENAQAWMNERQKHLDIAAELRSLASQFEESAVVDVVTVYAEEKYPEFRALLGLDQNEAGS